VNAIWRFLTSLKTCAWTGLAFTVAGAVGSVVMGWYPDLFGDMDATVFSTWCSQKGFVAPVATSWLYGLVLATGLLALNAACCTAERLVQIFRGKATLRRLLPHLMHIAFLGVVLSHLVSATGGDRIKGLQVPEGRFAQVGGTGLTLGVDKIHVEMAPQGYPKDFGAAVSLYRGNTTVARGWVRANEPLFHEGYGIYLKTFGPTPWGAPYAEFDANRDPGALPILLSCLLFTVANVLYLFPARKKDEGTT
jgi:hypothetical protein